MDRNGFGAAVSTTQRTRSKRNRMATAQSGREGQADRLTPKTASNVQPVCFLLASHKLPFRKKKKKEEEEEEEEE